MHRFLSRLSLVASLTIASSCTVQITQVQFPDQPTENQRSAELGFETPPLEDLDNNIDDVELDVGATEVPNEGLCERYEFPEIEEVPELPYVPPEKRGDDQFVSDLLVEHINRLTTFIDEAERKINASYQEYLEHCR